MHFSKSRLLNLTTSVGLGLAIVGTSVSAQSLSDALVSTYQNNPDLALARSNLAATDEGVASARSGLLPTVSSSATRTDSENYDNDVDSDTWTVSATASQTLYAGLTNRLNVEAAVLEVLSARQDLLDAEQGVLLAGIQAFMDVRRDIELVNLRESNVRVLQEQLRASNDRFEVGEVTRTDVAQTEARLAEAQSDLETARGNLNVARETYRAVVGVYPTSPRSPQNVPNLPATVGAAEAIAIDLHPRILAAQFDLSAAEVNLASARRSLQPTITGSVSVQRSNATDPNRSDDSASLTVTGSVPIYQGGLLNSNIREAVAGLNSAKSNLQAEAVETRQSVRSAYANWLAARASIVASREAVRASQIAFDGVSEEASLGARTTLDVLDAEQELRDAQTSLITAVRNEVVARYSVVSEMGQLTAEKLELDVEVYDPEQNYQQVNPNTALGERRSRLLDTLLERSGN
ncbi:MAG: TolC family outer membrane protein [Pseudomonadota bacterium]